MAVDATWMTMATRAAVTLASLEHIAKLMPLFAHRTRARTAERVSSTSGTTNTLVPADPDILELIANSTSMSARVILV
jgi:hypothetical protein